jgi:putative PIN family toxin of toxin-antitoxin system
VICITADTNIYISGLEFGGLPLEFLNDARLGRFRLAVSPAVLDEVRRVLRDKFEWTPDLLDDAFERIARFTTLVHPTVTLDEVPDDPDDNRILERAVAASSAYIVTGDRDLLRLGSYDGIKIMRVADLLTLLPTL